MIGRIFSLFVAGIFTLTFTPGAAASGLCAEDICLPMDENMMNHPTTDATATLQWQSGSLTTCRVYWQMTYAGYGEGHHYTYAWKMTHTVVLGWEGGGIGEEGPVANGPNHLGAYWPIFVGEMWIDVYRGTTVTMHVTISHDGEPEDTDTASIEWTCKLPVEEGELFVT